MFKGNFFARLCLWSALLINVCPPNVRIFSTEYGKYSLRPLQELVNAVVSRHQYSARLTTYSLWELEGETRIS